MSPRRITLDRQAPSAFSSTSSSNVPTVGEHSSIQPSVSWPRRLRPWISSGPWVLYLWQIKGNEKVSTTSIPTFARLDGRCRTQSQSCSCAQSCMPPPSCASRIAKIRTRRQQWVGSHSNMSTILSNSEPHASCSSKLQSFRVLVGWICNSGRLSRATTRRNMEPEGPLGDHFELKGTPLFCLL